MYILDTNVLSEMRRARPHGGVLSWIRQHPDYAMFVSAVSIGEIQTGIEMTRKQDPAKAKQLEAWCSDLIASAQVISMGPDEFREYARLMRGKSETLIYDAMIAATANTHGFEVVTRNVADFKALGIIPINPFNHRWNSGGVSIVELVSMDRDSTFENIRKT